MKNEATKLVLKNAIIREIFCRLLGNEFDNLTLIQLVKQKYNKAAKFTQVDQY